MGLPGHVAAAHPSGVVGASGAAGIAGAAGALGDALAGLVEAPPGRPGMSRIGPHPLPNLRTFGSILRAVAGAYARLPNSWRCLVAEVGVGATDALGPAARHGVRDSSMCGVWWTAVVPRWYYRFGALQSGTHAHVCEQ